MTQINASIARTAAIVYKYADGPSHDAFRRHRSSKKPVIVRLMAREKGIRLKGEPIDPDRIEAMDVKVAISLSSVRNVDGHIIYEGRVAAQAVPDLVNIQGILKRDGTGTLVSLDESPSM